MILGLHASAMCGTLQVDDLRKENQHLKRTMSKVKKMSISAEVMGEEPNLEAHDQYPENHTMDPFSICMSMTYSPILPEIPQPESVESLEIQDDETNDNLLILTCHDIPEEILEIIEAKDPANQDSDALELQNLENSTDLGVVQPSNIINICIIDQGFSPVHQSQQIGESDVTKPFKKLQFSESVTLTNTVYFVDLSLSYIYPSTWLVLH
jgi:hypothetical protein